MTGDALQDLPAALPVMVLPGITLFPNALLPLHIFETRYRLMLEEALGAGRMLVMANPRKGSKENVHEIAGAGLVRACIRNDDGTSNLILQGVSRVRLEGWEQAEPYPVARIRPLASIGGEVERLENQVMRLHALCSRFKEKGIELPDQFEAYLNQITNIGVITDLVASTLVADSSIRQELLEELRISKRIARLLEGLLAQLPR
jgi:Lon protease-like protein